MAHSPTDSQDVSTTFETSYCEYVVRRRPWVLGNIHMKGGGKQLLDGWNGSRRQPHISRILGIGPSVELLV
jgi:hypothetical protein